MRPLSRFALAAMAAALTLPLWAARPGEPAPDFTATDTYGRTHRLSDYRGKFVVLEWQNRGCPYTRKHYETGNMQRLQKQWTARGVVWLTIISSAPGKQGYMTAEEANQYFAQMGAAPTAVLLDPQGTVGHLYDAGVIEVADGSLRIEQDGGRRSSHLREVLIGFLGRHITLFAGCRGDDGEPDDAAGRPLLLEPLHVAGFVVLARVGAAPILPFQHDEFAAVIGEPVRPAISVGGREIGGRLTRPGSPQGQRESGRHGGQSETTQGAHVALPPLPKWSTGRGTFGTCPYLDRTAAGQHQDSCQLVDRARSKVRFPQNKTHARRNRVHLTGGGVVDRIGRMGEELGRRDGASGVNFERQRTFADDQPGSPAGRHGLRPAHAGAGKQRGCGRTSSGTRADGKA